MELRLGWGCSMGADLEGVMGVADTELRFDKVAELGREVEAIGCDVLGLGLMGGGRVAGGRIRGAEMSVDDTCGMVSMGNNTSSK